MAKKIFRYAFFILWVVLWINFMARDLSKKGDLEDYRALMSRNVAGKRAYAYDERLFQFFDFCKNATPASVTYDFIGIKEFSLDWRRGIYYLYPRTRGEDPKFLFVFDRPDFHKVEYKLYKKMDNSRFILERM